MKTMQDHAILRGGPCDGLIVELVGTCYQRSMKAKRGKLRFITAVYFWDSEISEDRTSMRLIGRFDGYRANNRTCRADGSMMPVKRFRSL